jgi:PAS domain S-box-containing protein
MRFGIDKKVNLLSIGIILFLGFLLGFYFIQHETRALNSELNERAAVLLSSLSTTCEYPILIRDRETISRVVKGVLSQKDVAFCRIEDTDGTLLFQEGSKEEKHIREFTCAVVTEKAVDEGDERMIVGTQMEMEQEIGKVYLAISLLRLNQKLKDIRRTTAVFIVVTMVLAFLASSLLLRFILSGPITLLVRGTERIAGGDLKYKVPVKSDDEIGILATSFNQMTENLQKITVSRDYVDNILRSMNDTLIVVSPEGTIQSLNAAASKLLGYHEKELIGQPFGRILKNDDSPVIDDLVRKGNISYAEKTYLSKDGGQIPVLFSAATMCSRDEQIRGFVFVASDITERKRVEAKLKQTLAELVRSNAELQHFFYVASHDLQEPLRMVVSYVQLLQRRYQGKLDTDADEYIAYAVDGTIRIKSLINDLLAYSRVGTRGRTFEPTECQAVVDQALTNLQVAIEERGAKITIDPLPMVMADGSQFAQLFQNLIGNAIKFHGENPPHVHIMAQQKENEWEFSVIDNGIGIAPEFSRRIFEVFKRLHTRKEYPGTGIGLAICKKIVERHGGRIWVEAESGKGSTFHFTIPKRVKKEARDYEYRTAEQIC